MQLLLEAGAVPYGLSPDALGTISRHIIAQMRAAERAAAAITPGARSPGCC